MNTHRPAPTEQVAARERLLLEARALLGLSSLVTPVEIARALGVAPSIVSDLRRVARPGGLRQLEAAVARVRPGGSAPLPLTGRPCPEGLDLTRTLEQLRVETGASRRVLLRWRREAGVAVPRGRRGPR